MGNSKSRGEDRFLSSHNGKHKISKPIICPICKFCFNPKTLYSVIDEHIESHNDTPVQLCIPEDHTYPRAESKIKHIRARLSNLRIPWSESYSDVKVSRDNILNDSLVQLLQMKQETLRSEFHIHFQGETSYDAGGLTKEWLNILITELFSSQLGLFKQTICENPTYLPAAHNCNIDYYKLFGLILGKAILENIPLNCPLCRTVLKHILGKSCSLRDIKYQDQDKYNSLNYMMENNIEGVFFETFTVQSQDRTVFLAEDGDKVQLNEANKMTYILLRTEYEVYGCFAHAVNAIKEGLFFVIPPDTFKGIGFKELGFMINGNPFINIKDWMANTEYSGDFSSTHKVILWFWEVICELSQEDLHKFLQFVTGTSQVPIEGFGKLRTIRGEPARFKIISVNVEDFPLPRAHTCFNRLDLPVYKRKIELRQALNEVIRFHLIGFGID